MGTEGIWIPALIAAAGAGVSEANNRRTARKRDEETAAGIRRQAETQRESNLKLNEVLGEIAKSSPAAARSNLNQQFRNNVRRQRALALGNLAQQGDVSEAAQQASQLAGINAASYAKNVANLLAGVDAAGLQRQNERKTRGNLAMDRARLGRNSAQDDFLTRLRVNRIQPHRADAAGFRASGRGGWCGRE
jgi:hypothetical protein